MGGRGQRAKESCCRRLCLLDGGLTTGDLVDIEFKKRIGSNDFVVDFFQHCCQPLNRLTLPE